ncbi:MAG: hypothetical protein LLF76_04700 [Planctomycetaceae bacterium]|nr:hypothetical protein [Planctomycetaceae bacterium]
MDSKFINEVAQQVQKLLTTHANAKVVFEQHVNKFNTSFLEYWGSTQATTIKVRCELQEDPLPKNAKNKQGLSRLPRILKVLDTVRKHPISPDPVNWEISDKWACRYMTLAVVHDIWIEADNPAPIYLCKPLVDAKLFGYMQTLIEQGWGVYSDKAIGQALIAIEMELSKQSSHGPLSFKDDELSILCQVENKPNVQQQSIDIAAACHLEAFSSWTEKDVKGLAGGDNCKFYADNRFIAVLENAGKHSKSEATEKDCRPPLGDIAQLIYEKLKSLPEHQAMTCPKIGEWLAQDHKIILDDSTIRKNHLNRLKPYGLFHAKRIGYCLRQ